MTAIVPVITSAGLTAALSADKANLQIKIKKIGFGTGNYTPDRSRTDLENEQKRIEIANGSDLGDLTFSIQAYLDGADEFWVREVGFYLEDGTLFAVWSDPTTNLGYKSVNGGFLTNWTVKINALPEGVLTIIAHAPSLDLEMTSQFAQMATTQINNMTRFIKNDARMRQLEQSS